LPRPLAPFFQTDLDSRLGGCETRGIDYLFFRKYSKDKKKRRLKTNLTLSLILRFNLRLGGYSIWSAINHRTPCKKRGNSGHEHLIASMQPKEYSKKDFNTELRKEVEDYLRSTRRACSTQLRRARGLVRAGATGLCTSRSPY
jgi:hypothetical protein